MLVKLSIIFNFSSMRKWRGLKKNEDSGHSASITMVTPLNDSKRKILFVFGVKDIVSVIG